MTDFSQCKVSTARVFNGLECNLVHIIADDRLTAIAISDELALVFLLKRLLVLIIQIVIYFFVSIHHPGFPEFVGHSDSSPFQSHRLDCC